MTHPVNVMYQNEILQLSTRPDIEEIAAKLPTLPSIKSSLYRQRRKRLPPMPQMQVEVTFEGEWPTIPPGGRWRTGQNFYLFDHWKPPHSRCSNRHLHWWNISYMPSTVLPDLHNSCNEVQPTVSTCILPSTKQDPRNIWTDFQPPEAEVCRIAYRIQFDHRYVQLWACNHPSSTAHFPTNYSNGLLLSFLPVPDKKSTDTSTASTVHQWSRCKNLH